MIKKIKYIVFSVVLVYSCGSCCTTKCIIYNLNNYVDSSISPPGSYIPVYDPNNSEWVRAEFILKNIVAPANWGTRRHQLTGLEFRLYIKTTKKNQKKISAALPTLWNPN